MRGAEAETWKRVFLRNMPSPAWLAFDAPHSDVVLSTRSRLMRNLWGHRFVHVCSPKELREIEGKAAKVLGAQAELHKLSEITVAERDYLVGCRLISSEFGWRDPGRAIWVDDLRRMSIMVNEEDHLRIQALTAGYSVESADQATSQLAKDLGREVEFAHSPRFGYLAASPFNAGDGRRLSAMFHLIGLASTKKLPVVLKALGVRGLTARGLFGESSRAIGAFVQVSLTNGKKADFSGACDYLLKEERQARRELGRTSLEEKARQILEFAIKSPALTLADSLRVIGWARWMATEGVGSMPHHPREIDSWLTAIEIRNTTDESRIARQRSDYLRTRLEAANKT